MTCPNLFVCFIYIQGLSTTIYSWSMTNLLWFPFHVQGRYSVRYILFVDIHVMLLFDNHPARHSACFEYRCHNFWTVSGERKLFVHLDLYHSVISKINIGQVCQQWSRIQFLKGNVQGIYMYNSVFKIVFVAYHLLLNVKIMPISPLSVALMKRQLNHLNIQLYFVSLALQISIVITMIYKSSWNMHKCIIEQHPYPLKSVM